MTRLTESTRAFTLTLRESLFAQVKENLEVGSEPERAFSDEEVVAFLMRHPDILGSIVRFDEVDTTDCSRIWEEQREEAGLPRRPKLVAAAGDSLSGASADADAPTFGDRWLRQRLVILAGFAIPGVVFIVDGVREQTWWVAIFGGIGVGAALVGWITRVPAHRAYLSKRRAADRMAAR